MLDLPVLIILFFTVALSNVLSLFTGIVAVDHSAFLGHLFANEFVGKRKELLAEPDHPHYYWQFDSDLPE